MKVTFFGTRGSLPIARADSIKSGGNTTCLLIESDCVPSWMSLLVDAGSGLKPASTRVLANKSREVHILQTHYHHDHTQGMVIAPIIYIPSIVTHVWGPVENGFGPRRVYEHIMQKPLHPVSFETVASHFEEHQIKDPSAEVILVHPNGGIIKVDREEFDRKSKEGGQFKFNSGRYHLNECLVIKMLLTNHPERTISYRFEERPTGKVFVFLTDNENTAGFPAPMLNHVKDADFMAHDTQYGRDHYLAKAAGWGHGTPDYVVELALRGGVKQVGFTHHEPDNSDEKVAELHGEGMRAYDKLVTTGGIPKETMVLIKEAVVICRDYMVVTL